MFKRIYIEITNVCNLNCGFCPKTTRKPEFIEIALFKKILNELKNHTRYLYFHVMGEPLLHPDIGFFLDLCHEYGYKVNITTNGMLIKKAEKNILLKPALRLMNFSLHSFNANTLNGEIDNYLDDIMDFISKAGSNPEFKACLRLWNKDKNQYILKKIEEVFNISLNNDQIPYNEKSIKLADNIFLNQASLFDWPDINIADLDNKGFCLGLRDQAAILVDGTVVPCCLDNEGTINLGNINDLNFSEIIKSKRAIDMFQGFSGRNAVESLCKKCGYRKRFNI
jgi:radical SAM protein with 4Fe4S-binding SPASM domain